MASPKVPLPALSPLVTADGTLFRTLADAPSGLFLLLYDDARATRPSRTVALDPRADRCGDLWELFVPGVGAGQHYLWAADAARPLLDPWALAISGPRRFGHDGPARPRVPCAERNRDAEWKSVVVAPPARMPARPLRPWHESVLYELHVRGFTRDASSGVAAPGTFRGLGQKAAYLADLGVTAVELMPVHEFDETEVRVGADLFNFWGYSPVAWFPPNRRFASPEAAARPEGPQQEFRAMVEAFHAAGLEVIVDVVFNHTAELDAAGPTWSLRGLDDRLYYLRDPQSGAYANHSGCGNTVRAQHPTVRALIRHALRWWAHALGADGFRFDLAAILCRGERGARIDEPPLIREIETDPWLKGRRLIAEPWDATGAHLVERWPGGPRWAVWNDRFRDDVRRAWISGAKGIAARAAGALATRLCGSSDLFAEGPGRGINFVTSHDGFTLLDCVSYARRHNEANGEGGRDGFAHEISNAHGVEGPDAGPEARRARDRSRRNLMASLLLSQGVPMLLAGDELGRTQQGNNNAYCQDNPVSWVDWRGLEGDAAFHRFVRGLLRFRASTPLLRRRTFLVGGAGGPGGADVLWYAPDGTALDWDRHAGTFAYVLSGDPEFSGAGHEAADLLVLVNLLDEGCDYALPSDRHGARAWRVIVDTAMEPPADFHEAAQAPLWSREVYPMRARSLALMSGE